MSSPHLPPETFDHIIDLLHDKPETLKECCLIAKSWVPRTRKHLFANIKFNSKNLESWKKTFPDPSSSPAHHTRVLFVDCSWGDPRAGVEGDDWIQSFSRIERLTMNCTWMNFTVFRTSFAPFYGLSFLKSLRVDTFLVPYPEILNLIHSLPLLEDLSFMGNDMWGVGEPPTVITSTLPALTGTLKLALSKGIGNTARVLLNLPNGLHFRGLDFFWYQEDDPHWMVELVVACSNTLEYLNIAYVVDGVLKPRPVDLSKATKLKHVVLRCGSLNSGWVTMTLETITSQHRDLQQISVHVPHLLSHDVLEDGITMELIEETNPGLRWSDLDRLLLNFWDSRSIRPRVVDSGTKDEMRVMRGWIRFLLPEIAKRGMVDLIEKPSGSR